MRRHIKVNICVWCNHDIITNLDFTNDCSIYSNPDTIFDNGAALTRTTIFHTDRTTFMEIDALSDNNITTHRYIEWMPYINSVPYG